MVLVSRDLYKSMFYLLMYLRFAELDMVISVSKVKDGDFDYVKKDIEAVREATGKGLSIVHSCLCVQSYLACELYAYRYPIVPFREGHRGRPRGNR